VPYFDQEAINHSDHLLLNGNRFIRKRIMIIGNNIILREPKISDWLHIKHIWEDEETMKDVGGIHELNEEKYGQWYRYVTIEKNTENKYFLIFDKEQKTCFGEVSFHRYDKIKKKAMFNIKVNAQYRNKGIGYEAMDLILDYYFNLWDGEIMEDTIWENNPNGLQKLINYGFREVRRDEEGIWIEIRKKEWKKKANNRFNLTCGSSTLTG
jgi:diamine N-acetyltransferase